MYKKMLCCLLVVALVLASGGTQIILPINALPIADGGIDGSETITTMPDFTDDMVLVVMTHEASLQFTDYTPADFPEIECDEIRDLSTGKGAIVQAVLRGEQLAMDSVGAKFMNQNVDISNFRRILSLKLTNPGKGNVLRAITALGQREDVYSAGPNYIVQAVETQTAALSDEQPLYGWAAAKIEQEAAWDIETGSNAIYVGILDSGIDDSHPELDNKVNNSRSRDFVGDDYSAMQDPYGHGTMVAGIIGAKLNDDALNFSGVCQRVRLVSLRIANQTGVVTYGRLLDALNYARSTDISILNLSLDINFTIDSQLCQAIENYNGLMVWAAGNSGENFDEDNSAPAYWNYEHIIVVGASTSNDTKASTSNYGITAVDTFAPGDNVTSCYPVSRCENNSCPASEHISVGYHNDSGTSFAAPFVTGVAVLIHACHSDATVAIIKETLRYSDDPIDAFSGICLSGGRLNAYNALTSKILHSDVSYSSINAAYHQVSCNDCDAVWQEAHLERPGVGVCIYCQEFLW